MTLAPVWCEHHFQDWIERCIVRIERAALTGYDEGETMMSEQAREMPTKLSEAFSEIERAAEERMPGVLDIIDTYQALPQNSTWQPVNVASISYATGVT